MGDLRQHVHLQVWREWIRKSHVAWKRTEHEIADLDAVWRNDVAESIVVVAEEFREVMQQHQQNSHCALREINKPAASHPDDYTLQTANSPTVIDWTIEMNAGGVTTFIHIPQSSCNCLKYVQHHLTADLKLLTLIILLGIQR